MGKLLLLLAILGLLIGCATATYTSPDGATLKVSRPIFASVSASATTSKGDIVSINASTSAQLDQLLGMALQGYAQYTSFGLARLAQRPVAMEPVTPTPTEEIK